jgi:hypothetical protein
MPPRIPRSVSDCRTHLRNVSAVQPIFDDIDSSAAHCATHIHFAVHVLIGQPVRGPPVNILLVFSLLYPLKK